MFSSLNNPSRQANLITLFELASVLLKTLFCINQLAPGYVLVKWF